MLICLPIIVVVIVGSEDIRSPFKLQVMVSGISPLLMTHVSCARLPWSIVSNPNEKGTIFGFSANITFLSALQFHTIYIKFCCVWGYSSRVLGSTSVPSTVLVVNSWYYQHACLLTNHCCGQHRVRVYNVPLETPGQWQWLISPPYIAGELNKISLVDWILPKGEWDNFW